jgi:hypothetical protein
LPVATKAALAQDDRRVEGRVQQITSNGPRPAPNVEVVLHRVGSDRSGPLDSARTDAAGRYAFRYRTSGVTSAIYFVSASYRGIAYFAPPLEGASVRGDDALITVFDTTSAPVRLRVLGHHYVVSAPGASGRREVLEVVELSNDTTVTAVSRDGTTPVWSAPLPKGAVEPRANPVGDIAAGAVTFVPGHVQVLAPISPGLRQLAYSYMLPSSALPLTITMERPADVVEVLLEEPRAVVRGPNLGEVEGVSTAGRRFRRFLARDVPANGELRVDVVEGTDALRARIIVGVAIVFGVAMVGALFIALGRRRRRRAALFVTPVVERPAERLVRDLAALDARFERMTNPSPEERARYESERGALKEQVAAALAGERQPA